MSVMFSQNRNKAKDSVPKNTNVINGTGVRIIKSCSSHSKSSQVKPAHIWKWFQLPFDIIYGPYDMVHIKWAIPYGLCDMLVMIIFDKKTPKFNLEKIATKQH